MVTIIKDTTTLFPELYLDVYVEGDLFEQRNFADMFVRSRCKKAVSPEKADLVVFTGGIDVNPALYGEVKHRSVAFDIKRDERDMEVYGYCLAEGIPMLGICRGAQFLHVMNGGKLYQDIDGHTGNHAIWDLRTATNIPKVSSVHHQSVRPNKENGMEVVATAREATKRWMNDKEFDAGMGAFADIEAFWYRDTACLGIQGHPEYKGYDKFLQWSLKQLEHYIGENPDLELRRYGGLSYRRMKKDLIAMRDGKLQPAGVN